jgi:hypothetical protein
LDYSSLPAFPPQFLPKSVAPRQERERRLTPRQFRVLLDLTKLACIVILFLWLRQASDAVRRPPPVPAEPLAFTVVAERFAQVRGAMPAEEVFDLLGPQWFVVFREPEMEDYDRLVRAHPERYPGEQHWAKWADPDNPARWVAVFISGGRVYKKLKRGI